MSTAQVPPTSAALVTADELLRDYPGVRCDLIDGKVFEMAPPGFGHGSIEGILSAKLWLHVSEKGLGVVATGEAGFLVARDPDTVLGADVAFVTKDRIASIGVPEQYFPEAPALAVEIVSPSDTADRVEDKARRWLAAGSRMVWVVYPAGSTVTVYRSLDNIRVLTSEQPLTGEDVVPGFSVPVAELFAGLDVKKP